MTIDLTGEWSMRQAEGADPAEEAGRDGEWLSAAVPGCVHLDLMAARRIPDPFYGFNDDDVQWVAAADWLYRRTFDCSADVLALKRTELVCEGLNTFATVVLNGNTLGRADNMFRTWRWNVTGMLRAEGNELLVLFESPVRVGKELVEADEERLTSAFGGTRTYVRKAQYEAGWDWGPNLDTSGIWRPIRLEGFDHARLADASYTVDWATPERPVVQVTCEIEALKACTAGLTATLDGQSAEAKAKLKAGANTVKLSIPVNEPRLWWPAGFGAQDLYTLTVTGEAGGEALEPATLTVGLRQVELRREADEEGESFVICVNGEPIFCRGANWIPADSFVPRLTREDYDELIGMAADANMNMLRVWGGGIYERPEFYDACDRLGIMVWQDMMFACGLYPDHIDAFCENVRAEARDAVRRLRNHPSLALWCGNNECQWQGPKDRRLPGRAALRGHPAAGLRRPRPRPPLLARQPVRRPGAQRRHPRRPAPLDLLVAVAPSGHPARLPRPVRQRVRLPGPSPAGDHPPLHPLRRPPHAEPRHGAPQPRLGGHRAALPDAEHLLPHPRRVRGHRLPDAAHAGGGGEDGRGGVARAEDDDGRHALLAAQRLLAGHELERRRLRAPAEGPLLLRPPLLRARAAHHRPARR